jgi:voltage-gated potassium channel Kch
MQERHRLTFKQYWKRVCDNVWENILTSWPILVALAFSCLVSAFIVYHVERRTCGTKISSFMDSLYLVWITMTTVGYGDVYPVTSIGKIVVCIDALLGLVLIGMIIWFVTTSLRQ